MEHAKILPLAEMINIFATPATGITIPAILFLRYSNLKVLVLYPYGEAWECHPGLFLD